MSKITDLGQQLGQARKDQAPKRQRRGTKQKTRSSADDLARHWPKPDFRGDALAGRVDPRSASLMMAVYRNLPRSISAYGVILDGQGIEVCYVHGIARLREHYEAGGSTSRADLQAWMDALPGPDGRPGKWVYALGRPTGRKFRHPLSLGLELSYVAENLPRWGWPHDDGVHDRDSFGVAQLTQTRKWVVSVATSRTRVTFVGSERYDTQEDALIACAAHVRGLATARSTERQKSNTARGQQRVGPALRNAAVKGDAYVEAFGFRGVEFGNWMTQADRQHALDASHDAFIDMTQLIGLPSRFASLGGRLGIAFGSRGHGRRSSSAAHFEPTRNIIHFTREHGAGTLAHEFGHALDYFIGRRLYGPPLSSLLAIPLAAGEVESPKLLACLQPHMRPLYDIMIGPGRGSKFLQDAHHLDGPTAKEPYWATPVEMFARAFETWIHDLLDQRSQANPYLVTLPEAIDANPAISAYPQGEERAAINYALDRLICAAVHHWTGQSRGTP